MDAMGEPHALPFGQTVWAAGSQAGALLLLNASGLGRQVRRQAALSGDPLAPARISDRWLAQAFGTCDDPLRRAAVAAMAIDLARRTGAVSSGEGADYPAALDSLHRTLRRSSGYDRLAYASDVGLVSGLHLPITPFRVSAPAPFHGEAPVLRLRKAAALGLRLAREYGVRIAVDWALRARLGAWAEFHLDLRGSRAFHTQGFVSAYRTVAEILRNRPDLAGARAGSWLFDPVLPEISPELAFVRRSAEAGGARFVPVRTNPEQRAFAAARSPRRRHLIETGAYRPACYTMSWLADDMIRWADRTAG